MTAVILQVITASEFHPKECNLFVYSSSKVDISLRFYCRGCSYVNVL